MYIQILSRSRERKRARLKENKQRRVWRKSACKKVLGGKGEMGVEEARVCTSDQESVALIHMRTPTHFITFST